MPFEKYNPDLHPNHGKEMTTSEVMWMCSVWEGMKKEDIALALGKTHGAIVTKGVKLRQQGLFEHFKKLGKAL